MENFNNVPSQGKFGDSIAVVNENFMLAQQKMEELQAQYNALTQSDIIVGALPSSGTKNRIYRVPDTNSYSDYMWNGSSFVKMAEYDNAIDDEPTPDSNNLVKSGGVAASVVFDISAYRATGGTLAKYADLAAALDGGNNIPVGVRKGGMSVKFVQSSDNKYVRFNLLAQSFTTDTTQWAIAEEGVYVENPEFVYVKTDNEGKILWAIKTDGSIYYGAGVPQQVVDYINEKIAELSLDEYEDIVAFLNDLEKGDKTLQDLLDTKVDKEEGKSLIDAEYAEGVHYIENPEFAEVKVDNEDRILEAIMKDGTKLLPAGVKVIGTAEYDGATIKTVENPEFAGVWLDNEEHILFGVQTDGNFLFGCGVPRQVKDYIEKKIADLSLDEYEDIVTFLSDYLGSDTTLKVMIDGINAAIEDKLDAEGLVPDALNSVQAVENPEFMEVELDANDKVLSGRKVDGTKFENNDVELNGNATVGGSLEVDGAVIKNIEDPENRSEVTLDSEDKIISYRKDDGTLVENVGIESLKITTDSLSLSVSGMNDFQRALKESGFIAGGYSDFSERKVVELPEPKHYALLNLIVGNVPAWWGAVVEGFAEYYDFAGNYFKKSISLETQGQTSVAFAIDNGKGNYTLDLTDDSEIKFGSWVPQDSFHLKGCAKDVTRSILPTSYKFAYKIMEYLDAKPSRVLLKDNEITTTNATGDRTTDWPDEARCLPDGFPVEIYVNGEYWGLYSWQLKKHRKNYSMKKSDYTSFFLDADSMMSTDRVHGFWHDGPDALVPGSEDRNWWMGFEIKNPKDLICMNGEPYDYDKGLEYREPIDETSAFYDSSNKKHKGSKQTKDIIRAFSTKYLEVKALIDAEDIVQAKEKFNEYFDYNACMLVYIFNCLMGNSDSIGKNTLWGTYKNGKIAPFLWDLDAMYGLGWIGTSAGAPGNYMWAYYGSFAWPLMLLYRLYYDEIKATYTELRDNNIISIETWKEIMYGWINRVGHEAYERDIEKWPETPSYRKNYTNTEYWVESGGATEEWNENTEYQQGDKVYLPMSLREQLSRNRQSYEAVQANQGVCPVTEFYNLFPRVGGYYDSPKRMEKWMIEQIRLNDIAMDYNN